MILKPRFDDIKIIFYYLGKVILGVAVLMALPFIISVLFKEWDVMFDFLIGILATSSFGFLFIRLFYTEEDMQWMHGMIVASLSWVVAMFFSAIPLYMSGHYAGFLDTCFETMSGYTTSGLTLVNDLDHIAYGHSMWRAFMQYVGGQGIIVVALSFLIKASGSFTIYVGEAKDEKILPNVINTARFIWIVSLVYLVIGTLAFGIAAIYEGISPVRAFFQGAVLFMAAWSTGGFTHYSQNMLYYHSLLIEIVSISMFTLGVLNFSLHYAVWTGNRKELFKNIETITLTISAVVTFCLCAFGLLRLGIYPDAVALFRKGFYQLWSGHTTTGFGTVYARQFVREWGPLALVSLIIAMGLGGCACSTAGGIKALRIGIIFKALRQDIKKMMVPYDGVVIQKFHHIKEIILQDKHVRPTAIIALCFMLLYIGGAIIGMLCGYPPMQALFESVSAAANVGLSCGITNASMPAILKLTFMFQMWVGRLEFMAVFALFGFIMAAFKGK